MTTRHATSLTNGEIVEENDLGSIRRVTADTLLILSGISIKRIVINPGAMRTPPRVEGFVYVLAAFAKDGMHEPHWHPITAEMGYVHTGSARMTVMDPDGTLDTWYLKEGDVYFIPRAYPHHIEVVDAPDLHFAIFFDQPTLGDIGYRASASAYSREVLAATFNMHIDDLPNFPFTNTDPLIVTRSNPVDEYAMGER